MSYSYRYQSENNLSTTYNIEEDDELDETEDLDDETGVNNQDADLSLLKDVRSNFENTQLDNIPYKNFPYFSNEPPKPYDIKKIFQLNPLFGGVVVVGIFFISIAIFNQLYAFATDKTFERIKHNGLDWRPIVSFIIGPILLYYIFGVIL